MLSQLRISIILLGCMTVLSGVIYPLVVTLIAQAVFPNQANGSLVFADPSPPGYHHSREAFWNRYDWSRNSESSNEQVRKSVGSKLIGQPFSRPEYFWGRLSATTPFPYNSASSSGSNFGPSNPALTAAAEARITALQATEVPAEKVPVDLVTASGSGLDPHISLAAAEFQVPRIAQSRKMKEVLVRELIRQHAESRQWGILGEPRVNVLLLNLALDHFSLEK